MTYIEKYKEAIRHFSCHNPHAGWYAIEKDRSKWYEFLEWLNVHRAYFLKIENDRFLAVRKEGDVFIPYIEKPIQDYLKCYNIVTNAHVEAQYLSAMKPTKANSLYVEFAKKVLPILEMEIEYFEKVLNYYFYAK